ncbi:hypothetical protein EYB26_001124 [Talaromyces marneffei]|uniref:UDP-N-acetylglucosamine transferase subunit ALG14 n=1 Tax=Talaromyces marneffei PM1 TaxID=1077442 RepID=A0A093Y0P7_TALMA|nr:uncharacterized protein EYB26_001124 [Talaromyces marneffei]QGA13474.1 hypothetical protein EYB26_001124 [Talaromyces marneffei]
MSALIIAAFAVLSLLIVSFALIISLHLLLSSSQHSTVPKLRRRGTSTHLLIVLGSGGHTAEMLSMLRRIPLDPNTYTFRTYIVTSGDSFSASKAVEFEATLHAQYKDSKHAQNQNYEVITVPRARRVHQSYLTAPFSTVQCFWACLQVLRGRHPDQQRSNHSIKSQYPDLILTNGPATAVCVVLGAKLLRFWNALFELLLFKPGQTPKNNQPSTAALRTIFIESWARVTTLSLSGKILLPLVDRFLVQWPNLEGKQAWRGMRKAEYVGTIIE